MLRFVDHATNGQEPYDPETMTLCAGSGTEATGELTEDGTAECPICARYWGASDEVVDEREACAALCDANGHTTSAEQIRARG